MFIYGNFFKFYYKLHENHKKENFIICSSQSSREPARQSLRKIFLYLVLPVRRQEMIKTFEYLFGLLA